MGESNFDSRVKRSALPRMTREYGIAVCLWRGDLTTDEFDARRSEIEELVMGSNVGIDFRITYRRFWLPIADVVFEDEQITPRVGDRIEDGSDVWELFHPDESTKPAELVHSDSEWLVHTKMVD